MKHAISWKKVKGVDVVEYEECVCVNKQPHTHTLDWMLDRRCPCELV